MKSYILQTEHLSKKYTSVNALSDVSIALEKGKIYGLIGKNGAGKTTLMKLITGIIFPTSGTISLFGSNGSSLRSERSRIGALIEYPGLIPYMSAAENLSMHRKLRGIPDRNAENELLTLTGLADTGKKKTSHFSLGMKQRLGIAIALLGNPELLILDEPANGLDPAGLVEIRHLITRLCEERQITILISSHNLPELYQTATDYIIIDQGRICQTLSLEQLDEKCQRHILIRCEEPERLVRVLESSLHTSAYKVLPDQSVKLYDYLDDRLTVSRTLYEHQIIPLDFTIQGDTLENYFLSVTGGEADV